MTAFKYFQENWTPVINKYLEKHLADDIDDQKISQIMSYSVMAGGKRLRPLLYLATLNTLGRKIDDAEIQSLTNKISKYTINELDEVFGLRGKRSFRR